MAAFSHINHMHALRYCLIQNSSGSSILNAPQSNFIALRINNEDKIRLTSDGKLGIGTTTPTSLLHVEGDVSLNRNVDVSGIIKLKGLNEASQVKALYYNTTTGEITYDLSLIHI